MSQSLSQDQLFALIDKFLEGDLYELKLRDEGFSLTLKRGHGDVVKNIVDVASLPAVDGKAKSGDSGGAVGDSGGNDVITSPIVGTFYRSPAPDAPVFIEEGAKVSRGDSLCIIEAMKIMNKLEAEFSCEIVNILAEDGQMVEYGTPLFEIKKS